MAEICVDSGCQIDIRMPSQSLNVRRRFTRLNEVGDEGIPESMEVGLATVNLVGNFRSFQSLLDQLAPATTRRPVPRPELRIPEFPGDPSFQELDQKMF